MFWTIQFSNPLLTLSFLTRHKTGIYDVPIATSCNKLFSKPGMMGSKAKKDDCLVVNVLARGLMVFMGSMAGTINAATLTLFNIRSDMPSLEGIKIT